MTLKCVSPQKSCPWNKDGLCFHPCVNRAVQAGIAEGAQIAHAEAAGKFTDVTNEPL